MSQKPWISQKSGRDIIVTNTAVISNVIPMLVTVQDTRPHSRTCSTTLQYQKYHVRYARFRLLAVRGSGNTAFWQTAKSYILYSIYYIRQIWNAFERLSWTGTNWLNTTVTTYSCKLIEGHGGRNAAVVPHNPLRYNTIFVQFLTSTKEKSVFRFVYQFDVPRQDISLKQSNVLLRCFTNALHGLWLALG